MLLVLVNELEIIVLTNKRFSVCLYFLNWADQWKVPSQVPKFER